MQQMLQLVNYTEGGASSQLLRSKILVRVILAFSFCFGLFEPEVHPCTDESDVAVAEHRYSRPYKKNEQSHIENFNKSLRSECFPRGEYQQKDIPKLQQQADAFAKHYIQRRWHMGLPDLMTLSQFKQFYAHNPETARLAVAKVLRKSRLG